MRGKWASVSARTRGSSDEPPRIPRSHRRGRRRRPAGRQRVRAGRRRRRVVLRRREALRQRRPAALHRLPRAADADLLSRAERQPRRWRGGRQAAAPRRRAPAEALRHRARHARGARVHVSRLRQRRAGVRAGGRLRAPRHARGQAQGGAARRAAARWRRHVAGLGDVAVDQGPGHGRRAEAAGRGRDDGALGVHVRRRARQGDRREGLRGQGGFRRAEREDDRLRRPGVQALRDPPGQRRAGRDHRPGVPVHADRQPALLRARVDVRHPGRGDAEGRRRRAREGRAGRRRAVAQRDGRRPQDGVARDGDRRDPGRPHARRRAAADARRPTAAARRSSATPAATASSSRSSIWTSRAARSPTSATACCPCSARCCRPIRP